jgi:hypothetical protein
LPFTPIIDEGIRVGQTIICPNTYLLTNEGQVVDGNDPKGTRLLIAKGCHISYEDATRYGLLKKPEPAPAEAPPLKETKAKAKKALVIDET